MHLLIPNTISLHFHFPYVFCYKKKSQGEPLYIRMKIEKPNKKIELLFYKKNYIAAHPVWLRWTN